MRFLADSCRDAAHSLPDWHTEEELLTQIFPNRGFFFGRMLRPRMNPERRVQLYHENQPAPGYRRSPRTRN